MKEPIIIVDEEDNLVGHVERSEIDYTTQRYRVTALWLSNSNGEVLIAQRKLTKRTDPGMWGPAVAGTVEKGESYDQNIRKEVNEELGLEGVDLSIGPKTKIDSPRMSFIQWYTAAVDRSAESFDIQQDEVEQVAWIKPEDLQADFNAYREKYVPNMWVVFKEFVGTQ